MQITRIAEFVDDLLLDFFRGLIDADFDELWGVFILGELDEVPLHLLEDIRTRVKIVLVQYLWHDEVTKFILDEL